MVAAKISTCQHHQRQTQHANIPGFGIGDKMPEQLDDV